MVAKMRAFVFTLNNYTPEELEKFSAPIEHVKYLCFGKEVGENGTPHLQGYVEFDRSVRIPQAKRFLQCDRVHLEIRRGTADEAIAYCKKDGDFVEVGERARQGSRSDVRAALEAARQEKTFLAAVEVCPALMRYTRAYQLVRFELDRELAMVDREVEVSVFWGSTGTGKTRRAMEGDRSDIYKLDVAGTVWFDGYVNQRTLVIDDFSGWISCTHLLNILDRYPLRLPVKGSFVYAHWTKVIITSNKPWFEWYNNISPEHKDALERRLNVIEHFE